MRLKNSLTFWFVFSAVFSANGQTILKERLEQHVYTLAADSLQGRKAGTKYAQMAANYIVKQFEAIGIKPYFDSTFLQTFQWHENTMTSQNVVGIIQGNDSVLKNDFIVVGAHFDHLGVKGGHIYNGADDNASGVAVLIELARKLKENQSNLKRSIILIAFDAEEVGLHGSNYFLNHFEHPTERIELMISVDMVGWYATSGELNYMGSHTIKNGKKIILDPLLVPEGLNVTVKKFERHPFRGTDTDPFAKKGIPTLATTTGVKSPYHKPEDEAHLIDFDGMVLITEHLKNLVASVAIHADYEASGRIAKKHKKQPLFMYGFSGSVGLSHHQYTAGALKGKKSISFGAGLVSQVNFGTFAIRPEVRYDRIRAKYPAGEITSDHLTVPLSLVVQYLQYGNGVDFFLGGYYAYRFDGKQGKESIDFENVFNREENGLTWGFGLYVRPFKIGFTSRFALTNFTKFANADHAHIRNRTNHFTVTFLF
ncbi:MAG: M20/M25/M40 family metallo-hydrolase [Bacteroidales bacterium]|nr:M20/M25/M40 family metallo-hydrolase [Bacteroidales bacterium]